VKTTKATRRERTRPGRIATAAVIASVLLGACVPRNAPPSSALTSSSMAHPIDASSMANAGKDLEQGTAYALGLNLHCGMKYIFGVDGRNWETSNPPYDGTGKIPAVLRDSLVDPNESVSPVLAAHVELLGDDELLLTSADGKVSVIYYPAAGEIQPCM